MMKGDSPEKMERLWSSTETTILKRKKWKKMRKRICSLSASPNSRCLLSHRRCSSSPKPRRAPPPSRRLRDRRLRTSHSIWL